MNILVAFVGVLFIVAGVLLFVAQRLGIVGLLALGAILIGLRKRRPGDGLAYVLVSPANAPMPETRSHSSRGRFVGALLILAAIAVIAWMGHT
jgi:hypothetical protein